MRSSSSVADSVYADNEVKSRLEAELGHLDDAEVG